MIYLDNNATAVMLPEVKQKMIDFIGNNQPLNASATHQFGRNAKNILEESRAKILSKITKQNYKLVFVPSATIANNQIIKSFNNVIVGSTEHSSVLKGQQNIVKVHQNGLIDEQNLLDLIKKIPKPFLVSISHANNETGVIQNIKQLTDLVHKEGGFFHSDIVQSFGKILQNIDDLNADYYTIASHKIGGPTGSAAILYKGNLEPFLNGGGQELGLFSGTENLLSIVGFAAAVANIDVEKYMQHVLLIRNFIQNKTEPEGVIIAKDTPRLPNTLMLAKPGVLNTSQLIAFDMNGIAVSIGSACSSGTVKESAVLKAMNCDENIVKSAIRISLGWQNTIQEAEQFIKTWKGL